MKRVTVQSLANEAGIDNDEALIALWDAGFVGINAPGDLLGRGEANRARRALGIATRRERAAVRHWADLFGCDENGVEAILHDLGVSSAYTGGKLTKKAQLRLGVAAKERGVLALPETPEQVVATTVPEPLVWEIVGHERECHGLSAAQVEGIHEELVADFSSSRDPIAPSGVKSPALLESAVHRPETSSGEVLKYPTVEMRAAALLHALVHNHPFHNGNKRTALVAMIVYIDENGLVLTAHEDELFKLVLQLAQHALVPEVRDELPDREVLAVAHWLKLRVRRKEKGDRTIPWRTLRRILTAFDCVCERAPRGQRMTVTRQVDRVGGWLRRKRTITLSSSFTNVQDGRDLDRNIISKLRSDLELDEAHAVDSGAFYGDAELSTSDFIRSYQGILRRLANV